MASSTTRTGTNDRVAAEFQIDAPNVEVQIYPLDTTSYAPGSNIFVTGSVINENTSRSVPGVVVTVWLEKNGVQHGATFNGTTNADGIFAIPLYIPEGSSGAYTVHGFVTMGDKTFSAMKNVTVIEQSAGGIPWYIYLVILAVIASAIIILLRLAVQVRAGQDGGVRRVRLARSRTRPSAAPSAAWSSRWGPPSAASAAPGYRRTRPAAPSATPSSSPMPSRRRRTPTSRR